MEIDKTTLADLIIYDRDEEFSVFSKINYTLTSRGKEQLKQNLLTPLNTIDAITAVQQTLLFINKNTTQWHLQVSNGTLLMVERFYEAQIDVIPSNISPIGALSYKLFHSFDFSLIKFSVKHCFDFIKGMQQLVTFFLNDDTPTLLKIQLQDVQRILNHKALQLIANKNSAAQLSPQNTLQLAYFIKYTYKSNMHSLLSIFGKLDAWYGMATAVNKLKLAMPLFVKNELPIINAKGMYHIMIEQAVTYDLELDKSKNFLFLTGANMAGKSTFIKACGTAVYLAHIGMGVPAKQMQLSFFDGILSNINVIDDIAKGESYFYNEVQRIKATVQKVSNGKKWLILIDELFKGTNVQDAMKCSTTVIEGLLKIKTSLFILSTHLYEIGDALKHHQNLSFNYFETKIVDDQLQFSYQLKEGISNDRLGYLILKKEGVVRLLENIA